MSDRRGRRGSSERRALDVYVKLHRAVSALQTRTNAFCSSHGLSVSQFAALEALFHKGPLCQRDLASSILRSGGNLTLVVDNLEKAGLVERRVSVLDRREKVVHLTDAGRRLIARIFPEHSAGIQSMMSVLSEGDQRELSRLCRKLGRAVSEGAQEKPTPAAANRAAV